MEKHAQSSPSISFPQKEYWAEVTVVAVNKIRMLYLDEVQIPFQVHSLQSSYTPSTVGTRVHYH
jgi:hypothetical protein